MAHGLRSLGCTILNEQGFKPDAIEAALSHADDNEIRCAYNRSDYFEQRMIMMGWWSDHIEKASQGNLSLASGFKALKFAGELPSATGRFAGFIWAKIKSGKPCPLDTSLTSRISKMAQRSTTATQPTTHVLPRDYCSVERAAQLLCCEVEDILQWAAEGAIQLMVNFDQWVEPVYGRVMDSCVRQPDDDGIIKLAGGRTWYQSVTQVIDDVENEEIELGELGGFWCVLKSDIYRNFLGQPLDEIYVFSPSEGFLPTGTSEALAIAFEFDNQFPAYWISRHSLIHLKNHIESGEVLVPENMLTNYAPVKHTHPRATATANIRELVLTAAIYVKDKTGGEWFHSEDTNTETAKGWAYKVECNQKMLFEGGKCPLATDMVARILGAAMNQGKPHKSK